METRRIYGYYNGLYEKGLTEGNYRVYVDEFHTYERDGKKETEVLGYYSAQMHVAQIFPDHLVRLVGKNEYEVTLTVGDDTFTQEVRFITDKTYKGRDIRAMLDTWDLVKRIQDVLSDVRVGLVARVDSIVKFVES